MFGSGREAFLDVREWSGGVPRFLGVVGRSCRMSGSGGKPSQMSRRLRGCPGVFERPSGMYERPSRMFGRSSRMSGTVQKALLDVREALSNVRKWSGGSL